MVIDVHGYGGEVRFTVGGEDGSQEEAEGDQEGEGLCQEKGQIDQRKYQQGRGDGERGEGEIVQLQGQGCLRAQQGDY